MRDESLCVSHARGSYPIIFDRTRGFSADPLARVIGTRRCLIVSNETVASLYLSDLTTALGELEHEVCLIPDGEQYKTHTTWLMILDQLVTSGFHRDAVIIALGGGVVGDIAGFAAASYQRGIDCIQIPTTLLAQVDSSVGGKTAINHARGKNLIGAFWQPALVLINPRTLATLSDREYFAGMAEVVKAAMLSGENFFNRLCENRDSLCARDANTLSGIIQASCRVKQELVESDERESNGSRALLNLGHTFGHAIETYFGYGHWLHGEAVSIGLVLATGFAVEQGLCDRTLLRRLLALLNDFSLPTTLPSDVDCAKLCSLMALDKKVQSGKLRMVLPHRLGHSVLTDDYQESSVLSYLESCVGVQGSE